MIGRPLHADHRYDAIVIGSGMSGGWAAKELAERGLKALVLERGRNVEHITDYPTAHLEPWHLPHRGAMDPALRRDNPIVSKCYAYSEATRHFFVQDSEHPYIQSQPFDWIKAYQVGGKSLLWARMTQRWARFDFEANARDGVGTDWPIRYEELAPYYSYVERFAGIQGNRDGLEQIPDGEFQPPMPLNALESHFKREVETHFPGRNVVVARSANLSQPLNGRRCLYRSRCERGCPYGGAFSANSVTIPAALATGNVSLRPFSVVHSIIYDEVRGRASGVRVIDANTKEATEFFADIVFVNAGTLNTTLILLNSTSTRFANGLGNDSGVLGHYLMDHNYRARVSASFDGLRDKYYRGRKPTGAYVPRFRNFGDDRTSAFLRGYSYSFSANRDVGNVSASEEPFGAQFKRSMFELGGWSAGLTGMGEMLPDYDNYVRLSPDRTDDWGVPLLDIHCEYKENEVAMTRDILDAGAEMLERAGFSNVQTTDTLQAPGLGIHEMGTARMGRDPATSILNGKNQMHAVPNVFVTDGACMASSACQNPSITYMALTARAVDLAVRELNRRNI